MDEEKRLSKKKNIVFCIIALIIACILLFPLYWAFITSLKTEMEIFQNPPTFFPHVINTKSYAAQVGVDTTTALGKVLDAMLKYGDSCAVAFG